MGRGEAGAARAALVEVATGDEATRGVHGGARSLVASSTRPATYAAREVVVRVDIRLRLRLESVSLLVRLRVDVARSAGVGRGVPVRTDVVVAQRDQSRVEPVVGRVEVAVVVANAGGGGRWRRRRSATEAPRYTYPAELRVSTSLGHRCIFSYISI